MSADRDLMDSDGENRALRTFLMQYGLPGLTVNAMRQHMKRSGWGIEYLPDFAKFGGVEHLTKAGAQIWIRHLLSMEAAPAQCELSDAWIVELALEKFNGAYMNLRNYDTDGFVKLGLFKFARAIESRIRGQQGELSDAALLKVASDNDYGDEDPKCILRLLRAAIQAQASEGGV